MPNYLLENSDDMLPTASMSHFVDNVIGMAEKKLLMKEVKFFQNTKFNGVVFVPYTSLYISCIFGKKDQIKKYYDLTVLYKNDELKYHIFRHAALSDVMNDNNEFCKKIRSSRYVGEKELGPFKLTNVARVHNRAEIQKFIEDLEQNVPRRDKKNIKFLCLTIKDSVIFGELDLATQYSGHELNKFFYELKLKKSKLLFRGIENEGIGNCFFEAVLDSGLIQLQELKYYKDKYGQVRKNCTNVDFL